MKDLISKLQSTVRLHISEGRMSSGGSIGSLINSSQQSGRSALAPRQEFSGATTDGKWLEKPQSFENILATSNVKSIGSDMKSKIKFTDVFVPEGVCMEPPVISNNLLEKVRLSSSMPNLRAKSLQDEASVISTTSKKKSKKNKREDPLAGSKVKHSKRSMSTINLRPKDSKTEKIIQLMAQSYNK